MEPAANSTIKHNLFIDPPAAQHVDCRGAESNPEASRSGGPVRHSGKRVGIRMGQTVKNGVSPVFRILALVSSGTLTLGYDGVKVTFGHVV